MKFLGVFVALVAVASAAPRASWTLQQLSAAIQDPATDPATLPYLEAALNELMHAIVAGEPVDTVAVALPVAESPVEAAPVAQPTVSSPLVQIIVNVNQPAADVASDAAVAPAPAVVPEIAVDPVTVVEQAPVAPVVVVDEAPVAPVVVVDEVPAAPVVVETPSVNPIDVIAVGAPEVNPIDVLAPIAVAPAVDAAVGPIV